MKRFGRLAVLSRHLRPVQSNARFLAGKATDELPSPHIHELEVRWGDMDAYGHVNNSQYLVYMESSRVLMVDKIFDEAGLPKMSAGSPGSFAPIVGSINIKYIRPVGYPATLTIYDSVSDVTENSMFINTKGVNKKTGETCFVSTCKVVFLDYTTGKRAAISDTFREVLRKYE
eukprot:TRINITY_DN2219_c1_g1_i1.p1 TRINITY_DN2219_c1_g1~~TRINITY_DN2219_c1_g1_i1.p1  ORF type:complete len:173 (+),score=30.01 TRINITY_DN2219_c1_g1_i1:58-576(+)